MFLKILVLAGLVVTATVADDAATPKSAAADRSAGFKRSLSTNCANSYSVTCLKLDIVSWVDKLNEDDSYSVVPGVTVVRENVTAPASTANIVAELAREFPDDPDARLDAFLLKKVAGYFNSHSIKLNLWDNKAARSAVEEARKGGGGGGGLTGFGASGGGGGGGLGGFGGSGGGGGGGFGGGGGGGKGGGKKGGGGGMGYLLAAAAMMKGTLGALALGGIAALAGKALMAALISLMLSAIVGLKGMGGGGGKTTYEVVSKPIYTHQNTHSSSHVEEHAGGGGHYGHSSYGRSFDTDLPLPLGLQPGYKPPQ